jgi:hypothetical protein
MTLIELYNLALARIAISKLVTSPTDSKAEVLNVFYPNCRDRVLEEFPWGFAQRHAALALAASATDDPVPQWAGRWAYGFAVPSDAVVVRSVTWPPSVTTAGSALSPPEEFESRAGLLRGRIPFELEEDGAGAKLILTNLPDAVAVYTFRQTDVTRFPPSFASALAWLLASEVAAALSLSDGVREKAVREYESALSRATANDANHRQDAPEPDSEFVTARR